MEVGGPTDLDMLLKGAHPEAQLLHHAAEHRVSISLPQGIDIEDMDTAILYGTHTFYPLCFVVYNNSASIMSQLDLTLWYVLHTQLMAGVTTWDIYPLP